MRSPILLLWAALAPNLFLCQLHHPLGVPDVEGLHRDWKP